MERESSDTDKMRCYAVFSPSSKPIQFHQRKLGVSRTCELPRPFPPVVVVFVLSSEPVPKDLSWRAVLVNHGNSAEQFEIGTISQENRALCWQPSQSKQFHNASRSKSHKYQLHIGTETELKDVLMPNNTRTSACNNDEADAAAVMAESSQTESSQTESQEVTMAKEAPEADRFPGAYASPRTRLVRPTKISPKDEETPQSQVQTTPRQPPYLSHSASKKRKTQQGGEGGEAATPPPTRKRQSTRQKPSPGSSLSSPLSSRNAQTEKTSSMKRSQGSLLKKSNDSEPSGRWGHTLCDIGDKRSLLVGGQGHRQTISKDAVWLLNTESATWSIPPSVDSSDKFPSRMGHTATFDPQEKNVLVFGGSKNLRWFSDMHILNLETWKWSLIEACGVAPTRSYHSATFFRNELYIFGGVYPNPDPQPDGCSNDVFIFSPDSESWYKPVTMGTKPKPRSGHSATLLGDQLVIFGGWDAPVCFNDLHILDLCLMEFSSPTVSGTPPSPRSWHASIGLHGNQVLIHGGYNGNEALADAHIFNLDTLTWTSVDLLSDIPVGIRAGHAITHYRGNGLAADEKENDLEGSLAIFGGGDNEDNFFDDLIPFKLT